MLGFWDTPNTQAPQRTSACSLHHPSEASKVTERLVPSHESPHLSFIPVATGRTASELSGRFTSVLSQSEYPLGTPQATRGEGGSITPLYCQLVISRS